uniref:Uncharacterized protein n=1 Tax=Anguilla anguilla TaxID=7936 RepID=A0A0E9W8F6_ANGAN
MHFFQAVERSTNAKMRGSHEIGMCHAGGQAHFKNAIMVFLTPSSLVIDAIHVKYIRLIITFE